jgi:hypothetical protein
MLGAMQLGLARWLRGYAAGLAIAGSE